MYPVLVKEIRSKKGELHFKRWSFLSTPWFNIYLHYIAKSDEDDAPHNHPWNFFTLVLKGGYVEDVTNLTWSNNYAMWIISHSSAYHGFMSLFYRKIDTFHKIIVLEPTYTLVVTGAHYDEWGYCTSSGYMNHKEYREVQNEKSKRDKVVLSGEPEHVSES